MNVPIKSNNRGHREGHGDGMYFIPISRANQFTLVQIYQNKRTLHGANHKRAKILIQYQNTAIHKGKIKSFLHTYKIGPVTTNEFNLLNPVEYV